MAKRDHLTAVPTVDKNGRQTTVYRKSGQGSKGSKQLPSPAVDPSTVHRIELNRKVSLELLDSSWHDAGARKKIVEDVRKLSVGTVTRIDQLLEAAGDDGGKLKTQIINEFLMNSEFESSFEAQLNHALHFYPVLPDRPYTRAKQIIGSLSDYPMIPRMKNFDYADDELMGKSKALARAIDAALTLPEGKDAFKRHSFVFEDDRFTELLMEHPEHAEQIAAVIRDRRTLDTELITMVIHGEASALGSGAL